jgi:hypothetical protein
LLFNLARAETPPAPAKPAGDTPKLAAT